MKKMYVFLLAFMLMTGCSRGHIKQGVELGGNVKTTNNGLILVMGNSNLAKGAKITSTLMEKDTKKVLEKKNTLVKDKGEYSMVFDRPVLEKEYQLEVQFLPDQQPKKIKNRYGAKGEYIKENSEGYYTYNKEYHAVGMFNPIESIIVKGPVRMSGGTTVLQNIKFMPGWEKEK